MTYTPRHRAEVPTDLCPCGFVDCHICPQTGGRHRAEETVAHARTAGGSDA